MDDRNPGVGRGTEQERSDGGGVGVGGGGAKEIWKESEQKAVIPNCGN